PLAPFTTADCAGIVDAGTRFYQLVEEERLVQCHPQLPATRVWGYRDVAQPNPFVPGPTFMERMNRPVVVRFINNLPAGHQGFGDPRTTVHHHGGHQEARSDGFPTFFFGPGESFDYCYPMLDRGFSHGTPDTAERTSTDWYHDHLIDFTGPNVYRGLAGFYLVFDELDSGVETDPASVRLPSAPFDVPLVVQDKRFDRNGQLVFDPFNHDGFLGDKFCVNGAVQPFLRVKRRRYRFRFLNGSTARIYQLFLADASGRTFPFDQVATDGGLLAQSIPGITSFQFAPAERVEIVIDFAQFPATTTALFLENRLQQTEGRKPDGLVSRGPQILKFILEEPVADGS